MNTYLVIEKYVQLSSGMIYKTAYVEVVNPSINLMSLCLVAISVSAYRKLSDANARVEDLLNIYKGNEVGIDHALKKAKGEN